VHFLAELSGFHSGELVRVLVVVVVVGFLLSPRVGQWFLGARLVQRLGVLRRRAEGRELRRIQWLEAAVLRSRLRRGRSKKRHGGGGRRRGYLGSGVLGPRGGAAAAAAGRRIGDKMAGRVAPPGSRHDASRLVHERFAGRPRSVVDEVRDLALGNSERPSCLADAWLETLPNRPRRLQRDESGVEADEDLDDGEGAA